MAVKFFLKSSMSLIVFLLTFVQVILLFIGITILGFGVVLIISNDILVGDSYKNATGELILYIEEHNITMPRRWNTNTIGLRHREILMSTQFLIKSALRSFIWFGKFYVFFGLGITLFSLLGLLGFSSQNMICILIFSFSCLSMAGIMFEFVIYLKERILFISYQALTELYSFFDPMKCTICWKRKPVKFEVLREYLSNIIAVGSAVYKCCGIASFREMIRNHNVTAVPMQCCKVNVSQKDCQKLDPKIVHKSCLRPLAKFLTYHSLLKYNNTIFSNIIIMLFIEFSISLLIAIGSMYKEQSYCFRLYNDMLASRSKEKSNIVIKPEDSEL